MGVDWWKQLTFLFSFLLSPSPFSFLFFFLCHHPLWTGIVLCSQTKNRKQGEPEPQFNCCKQHLRSFHCHIECLEHQRTIDLTIACVLCQNKRFNHSSLQWFSSIIEGCFDWRVLFVSHNGLWHGLHVQGDLIIVSLKDLPDNESKLVIKPDSLWILFI